MYFIVHNNDYPTKNRSLIMEAMPRLFRLLITLLRVIGDGVARSDTGFLEGMCVCVVWAYFKY